MKGGGKGTAAPVQYNEWQIPPLRAASASCEIFSYYYLLYGRGAWPQIETPVLVFAVGCCRVIFRVNPRVPRCCFGGPLSPPCLHERLQPCAYTIVPFAWFLGSVYPILLLDAYHRHVFSKASPPVFSTPPPFHLTLEGHSRQPADTSAKKTGSVRVTNSGTESLRFPHRCRHFSAVFTLPTRRCICRGQTAWSVPFRQSHTTA